MQVVLGLVMVPGLLQGAPGVQLTVELAGQDAAVARVGAVVWIVLIQHVNEVAGLIDLCPNRLRSCAQEGLFVGQDAAAADGELRRFP